MTVFMRCMLLLLALSVLPGCLMSPLGRPQSGDAIQAGRAVHLVGDLSLPRVSGIAGCGSQALACALNHAAPDRFPNAETLAADLPWHDEGATPIDILLEARSRGAQATIYRGDRWRLAEHLMRGHAILVMLNASPVVRTLTGSIQTTRVMHWAVVSGMRRDASEIMLAAEGGRHAPMPRDSFMSRWRASDYCMVVITGD